MSAMHAERIAEMFVQAADTLVDDFDLIEFLQMVTTLSAEFTDAAAAGLLLGDHEGRLQFMAASDEETRLLELFQVQIHEGPCQDCFREGTPVLNADLAEAAERWPLFAPKAVEAGFRSVHAFPLRLRGERIGALNLFGHEPGRMQPSDARIVQALADVATIGLLQERAIKRGELLTEQLQGALNSRVVIEQAKGAIAQRRDIDVDAAFALIRDYARSNGLRLGVVAHAVLDDPASMPDLTAG
ncbi:MAG TPA: GAF and ANTAR domain-containing protein [Actinomycetales bacterium]|nr:GAF and ANTAR domain-containing protein [Actinomycetales bacterium]